MPAWTCASSTDRARGGAAARLDARLRHPAVKPLVFVLALLPFASLLAGAVADTLGANPAEALIRGLGDWTLRLLCLTLAVTPLRQALRLPSLARLRRMLGLFTFFYAALHLLAYAWLDMGLVVADIVRDVAKRPFILVGSGALLLMLPLAATSFDRAIRALGARRWRALHRAVYVVAALALLHFFWMRAGKNDFGEVGVYAAVVAALLGWRLARRLLAAQRMNPGSHNASASTSSTTNSATISATTNIHTPR
ncbi:MAG: protein-methionine-sulfoxide reductase heme-binding subunit MsrQ [Gammaproteobacteria bacterium]|uniref:sulfite oxidase heme-binding subunit YedZ n=1 Tax=Azohydromonas sp. TaxID=1872666 RepID=UPI002C776E59|nr:protein-methionine-sulfoxide reductase heme-binding subunit MsrQ [Azohydromonas sp.]HMM84779.1 protein-methionine-sulfoxide reductase heme-binding subunit MsrQ [Azohydromonas sp.]